MPTLGRVVALQDRDCIDRLKFRYQLLAPLPGIFFEQFPDARVVIRQFSTMVPLGRDLFTIDKPAIFRAAGVVGDTKLVVTFHGSPRHWPRSLVDDFGRQLIAAGYSTIAYRGSEPPRCADCALRAAKDCQGGEARHR